MSEVRFDASKVARASLRRETPWWGVHAARYQFALPHVVGARVLDIACGTGYGLPVLQTQARWVAGVDVDIDAARKARAELGNGRGAVLVADGCLLPFPDASFDVVTSFETLEHLHKRAQYLAELKRVLTPEGVCIISTPNANYTRPINGKPLNPHHVFEYTPAELLAELGDSFANIELLGQTLGPHFVISPFLEDQERLPHTARAQARLILWRVINKMPVGVRDHFSQLVWGHPLFPGDTDYNFSHASVTEAPVLVAISRARAATE